jgi:hypothetical protein
MQEETFLGTLDSEYDFTAPLKRSMKAGLV